MTVKVTGYNNQTGNPQETLNNPTVVVGKTRLRNNNALMNRLQVAIGEALEITGVTNGQPGLRSNARMNHLQVATGETLAVAGVMNNPAVLHNLRATSLRHAASTGAVIVAAVEVAGSQDHLAEIRIMVVVAIPVVDSADQEDSDNIFFIIHKAVSIDAAFFVHMVENILWLRIM
jgi:hypothetical protein